MLCRPIIRGTIGRRLHPHGLQIKAQEFYSSCQAFFLVVEDIDLLPPDLNSVLDGMIAKCTVEGQSKYMCQTCGKTMDNRAKMKRHAEVHLDMSHSCIVCQKQFKTRNALSTHYTRYHGLIFRRTTTVVRQKTLFWRAWYCSTIPQPGERATRTTGNTDTSQSGQHNNRFKTNLSTLNWTQSEGR